jgi:hypothetical protein
MPRRRRCGRLDCVRRRSRCLGRQLAAGDNISTGLSIIKGRSHSVRGPPYDLVACLYVHVAGSVEEMVERMAAGVAPGGTLLLVGHRPIDPATGAATPAAGQVQVSVDEAVAALDPARWEFVVAEDRPRAVAGTGVDAVIRARRLS